MGSQPNLKFNFNWAQPNLKFNFNWVTAQTKPEVCWSSKSLPNCMIKVRLLSCHNQHGRQPQPKWKTTSTKMEDDLNQNGRRPKWKTNKMEDNQNGRRPKWKTTKIEDDQNG